MKKIGFIGFGNMGSAIFDALIESEADFSYAVCDKSEEKLKRLIMTNREMSLSLDHNEIINMSDIVVIAIKPQGFDYFADSIDVDVSGKVFVSIMAGVGMERMQNALKTKKVVRTMPNLPAQVMSGITGVVFADDLNEDEQNDVNQIVSAFSYPIVLKTEDEINKITALSGSGPAYFFSLCQFLQEQAQEMGFSEMDARVIAEGTFIGSARVFEAGDADAKTWAERVTSKGGTTEACLNYLKDNDFDKIFKRGIMEAKKRADDL
jgi:pyrroline-5-carboxylate reductase